MRKLVKALKKALSDRNRRLVEAVEKAVTNTAQVFHNAPVGALILLLGLTIVLYWSL